MRQFFYKSFQFIRLLALALVVVMMHACNYLDVVPEGVSTLDNAFTMRNQAIKYLYTCYSFMPQDGNPSVDPALVGGDEVWAVPLGQFPSFDYQAFNIALGLQNANSPLIDNWGRLFQGIRVCNIFLENIHVTSDLEPWERDQWIAEVTFLKAYYHFYLLRMYGPIPIVKENLSIDATTDKAQVYRYPVDTCANYIVELLDQAIPQLPLNVQSRGDELGRITKPIALALKAKVLVTVASPLFNGNTEQATLRNTDGTQLFPQMEDRSKWARAEAACREAVEVCLGELGMTLYEYPGNPQFRLSDTILRELTLRNSFAERWNSDIIWGNTQSLSANTQQIAAVKLDTRYLDYAAMKMVLGVPIKIAEQFYSDRGVPINEDRVWGYSGRFDLKAAGSEDNRHVREGYQTVRFNYNREARFYAFLGFDGGLWYGQGRFDDRNPSNLFYVSARKGQPHGLTGSDTGPVTGYHPKKWINSENVQLSLTNYSIRNYAWPIIRLSDLLLLYAEAINESSDSEANRYRALEYVDQVRKRAGLETVDEAWTRYSTNPNKFRSQAGLRQIIQQERLIELCLEGQRFWDIRRWKVLPDRYATPIQGWDLSQQNAAYYYRTRLVYNQEYRLRDYFWPIAQHEIVVNPNLVQNIGW